MPSPSPSLIDAPVSGSFPLSAPRAKPSANSNKMCCDTMSAAARGVPRGIALCARGALKQHDHGIAQKFALCRIPQPGQPVPETLNPGHPSST